MFLDLLIDEHIFICNDAHKQYSYYLSCMAIEIEPEAN